MIRLLVKGGKFTAAHAAAKHGVPMVFEHEERIGERFETYGLTNDEHYDAVARWFNRDDRLTIGYGFPEGTLLHFQLGVTQ